MIAVVTLIIWLGGATPYTIGQYETKEQCHRMVQKLLSHGVGFDEEFKFQCIDPREETEE